MTYAPSVVGLALHSHRISPGGLFMYARAFRSVSEFMKREDGPTAVEYAVMLSLIIVVCLAAISVLGQKASGTFTSVGSTLGAS